MQTRFPFFFILFLSLFIFIGCTSVQISTQSPYARQAQFAFDEAYYKLKSGKEIEALTHYAEAARLAPDSYEIWQEYCIALRKTNHLQRAAQACWRSIELKENNPGSWGNLANVFLCARNYDAAYKANLRLDQLTQNKTYVEDQFTNVGFWAWIEGDNEMAHKALSFVLERNPSNVKALVDYGELLASQGKVEEGRKALEQADRHNKDRNYSKYISWVLKDIDETGTIKRGFNEEPYQRLPDRFLNQPQPGKALNLRIDEYVDKIFPVKTIGKIKLTVPEYWQEEFKIVESKDSKLKSITITLHPGDKTKFKILITVFPVPKERLLKDSIKKQTKDRVDLAREFAVEDNIDLHEISNNTVCGYYFFVTDKSCLNKQPNDEDYLYAYQGLFNSGKAMIVSTAFVWDLNDRLKDDIVNMFSSFNVAEMGASGRAELTD